MNMNPEMENRINQTLESLGSMQRAKAPGTLRNRVMEAIAAERFRIVTETVSMQTVYRIAAAVAVIISLNAYTCLSFSKNQAEKKAVQALVSEYSYTSTTESLPNI